MHIISVNNQKYAFCKQNVTEYDRITILLIVIFYSDVMCNKTSIIMISYCYITTKYFIEIIYY